MQQSHIPMSLWADWPFFLAAYRAGSLTAAARALQVEQSTVSRRISRLEVALGQELFHRTPEGLLPTELALALLPDVERGELAMAQAFNRASGADTQASGTVRVAAPESMAVGLLAPALPALRSQHPGVHIAFVTGLSLVDLTRREADIGVRIVPPTGPDLVSRRVARYTTGIYATRELAERVSPPGNPLPADAWPWVGVDSGYDALAEGRWHKRHTPAPVVASDSYLVRLAATEAGAGCALLPTPWADRIPHLVELDLGLPPGPTCEVYLVTHRALRRVPRIEAVWAFLTEVCAELGGANS